MTTKQDALASGELFAGKSLVNIVPRNNDVLLRIEFEESILALASGKPTKEPKKVNFYVAGFGPNVKDLQLGERVIFYLHEEYVSVPIKGNVQDTRSLTDFYSKLSNDERNAAIKSAEKAHVIEYGLFPEFLIKAHTGE